ncbi:bactericidal permeability-increasing protein-like [Petromyzon marinus]|uniref:bactericidal permeability-increasing protein-like n=1 Tax=Petromyzon marinus TaxID=7757 RepID=UPI003F6F9C05
MKLTLLVTTAMALQKMTVLLTTTTMMMMLLMASSFDEAAADGTSSSPGLEVHITPQGLQYALKVGRQLLEKRVKDLSVAPISGSTGLAVGKVIYVISGLAVVDMKVPAARASMLPRVGVQLQFGRVYARVRGDWIATHKIASDRGSFELTVSGMELSTSVSVSRGADGRPSLHSVSCSVHLDDTDIRFFGNGSWLYNLVNNFIEMFINSRMEGEICPHLKAFVDNDVNAAISTLEVTVPVLGSSLTLDLSLLRDPDIQSNGVHLYLKGDASGEPGDAGRVPVPAVSGAMVTVALSESLINSLAASLFRAGVLSYNVTESATRDNGSIPLTAQSVAYYLPEMLHGLVGPLSRALPAAPLALLLHATAAPRLSVSALGVSASASVRGSLLALPPSAGPLALVSLDLEGTLQHSSHAVLLSSLKGLLTERLAAGVEVPGVGRVKLANVDVTAAENFIVMSTSVEVDIG